MNPMLNYLLRFFLSSTIPKIFYDLNLILLNSFSIILIIFSTLDNFHILSDYYMNLIFSEMAIHMGLNTMFFMFIIWIVFCDLFGINRTAISFAVFFFLTMEGVVLLSVFMFIYFHFTMYLDHKHLYKYMSW